MKLNREIEQWANCVPADMARMSETAIMYALSDARSDILSLYAELIMARASEQAALDRAARVRFDFQRDYSGQLRDAVAAERKECAAMTRWLAEEIFDPLYANRVRQLAGRMSERGTT